MKTAVHIRLGVGVREVAKCGVVGLASRHRAGRVGAAPFLHGPYHRPSIVPAASTSPDSTPTPAFTPAPTPAPAPMRMEVTTPAPNSSNVPKLKIGVVGFGTFGQFLARRMVKAGHTVLAYNARANYQEAAYEIGATYFSDPDDFCEAHPEVVILCTSILSTQSVISNLPTQRLRRSTLFVDVLSVKTFPKMLMLDMLPPESDILCTHPMFGPNSGAGSWEGLNFQFEKVRILPDEARQRRVDAFLQFFTEEGCNMVEMTCEEHDRQAASTQFVTHTVGRMLGAMELEKTSIDTKGYEALQQLVAQTNADSFDLYYGLFLYNKNAVEELERMEEAFDQVKKKLFARLHGIAREQIFPEGMLAAEREEKAGAGGGSGGVGAGPGAPAAAAPES